MQNFICSACGSSFPPYCQYDVEEKLFCPNCAERLTINCAQCGARILKVHSQSSNTVICENCQSQPTTNQ